MEYDWGMFLLDDYICFKCKGCVSHFFYRNTMNVLIQCLTCFLQKYIFLWLIYLSNLFLLISSIYMHTFLTLKDKHIAGKYFIFFINKKDHGMAMKSWNILWEHYCRYLNFCVQFKNIWQDKINNNNSNNAHKLLKLYMCYK